MNEFDQAILGTPQGDEYDQAVSAQPPDAVPARFGYLVGSERDPEAYAEARRVAASTGVPVDTVLALPQEMKRQAAMGSIDFDAMAATAPATASLLADVQKASVAHDNVASLQSVEQTINALAGRRESKAFAPLRQAPQAAPELGPLDRALNAVGDATSTGLGFAGGTLSAIAAAIPKFNEGAWGLLRAGGDMLPSAVGQPIADFASQMGGAARGLGDTMMPKADGLLGSAWYSGMQSFGLNLLQLPLAFLPGGQAPLAASIAAQVAPRMSPVLWSMGAVTGGEAYGKARDKGVGVLPSLAFGASQGVIEAGTEMIGMPALFSLLKPGKFAAKAGEYLLKEQGGEQLATHMQDLNEWAVLNPDKPFSDYLHERPAAAVQTALSVLFAGAAQAGTVRGVGHVLYKARDEAEKAQASEQQAQLLTKLTQIAQADKLLAREPDTFEAFVAQAAEDGPVENVYIDGNVLMQSGLMPQLAEVSPAIAAQAADAAKAGGLVAIPVGEYTARIAPTEQGQALLDHLKTDPEGFSRAEAQQYLQTQGEQLQQDIIKSLTDSVQAEQALADVATVRNTLKDELLAAGRRTDVADAESAVLGAYYATRAQDLGLKASELFEQRRLRIGSQQLGGEVFGQAEELDAVQTRLAEMGVDADLSQSSGVITLSKIVVPEGARGTGVGTQAMQTLVDYADRTGQHIALTPSSDFGGDKKRLTAFYKRFGFVENKGKNRAFSTKEGMYRQAAGKVLYQSKTKAVTPEQRAENFARWSDNAPMVTSAQADTHDFKTGQKIVVEAYHGSARPDRIGSVFDPKRATSGPMAFFTSSPELASNYANNKADTSLADEDQHYANWFKFKPAGSRSTVSIDRAWHHLDPEVKARIRELAPQVALDDDSENVVLDPGNTDGLGNYDWELQQTRSSYDRSGNPIKALVESWLSSGTLFNQEDKFMDVLRMAGFPMSEVTTDFPNAAYPGVFKTFVSMKNPLVVSDIPAEVRSALEQAARADRTRAKPGADQWDKRSLTLRDWWARFNDSNPRDAAYAWTSIPDKVTDILKAHGYDGIVDWSGKGGGHQSPVYVPFAPTQVKGLSTGGRSTRRRRTSCTKARAAPSAPSNWPSRC